MYLQPRTFFFPQISTRLMSLPLSQLSSNITFLESPFLTIQSKLQNTQVCMHTRTRTHTPYTLPRVIFLLSTTSILNILLPYLFSVSPILKSVFHKGRDFSLLLYLLLSPQYQGQGLAHGRSAINICCINKCWIKPQASHRAITVFMW